MSRTRRRKNISNSCFYLMDYDLRQDGSKTSLFFLKDKHENGKKTAFLYGDSSSGVWSPPKSFKLNLNRKMKRRNNKELSDAVKNNHIDSLSLSKWIKNAGWIYW